MSDMETLMGIQKGEKRRADERAQDYQERTIVRRLLRELGGDYAGGYIEMADQAESRDPGSVSLLWMAQEFEWFPVRFALVRMPTKLDWLSQFLRPKQVKKTKVWKAYEHLCENYELPLHRAVIIPIANGVPYVFHDARIPVAGAGVRVTLSWEKTEEDPLTSPFDDIDQAFLDTLPAFTAGCRHLRWGIG